MTLVRQSSLVLRLNREKVCHHSYVAGFAEVSSSTFIIRM
jgi:hypothetical protein